VTDRSGRRGKDCGAIEAAELKKTDQHTAFIEKVVSTSGELVIEFAGEATPSVSRVRVEKR